MLRTECAKIKKTKFRRQRVKMKNAVDKIVEKIKTHVLCSLTFILKNHAIYEGGKIL
jgi:hypothetical protein